MLSQRLLGHSHVNEQPFACSGNTVRIAADELVTVRAHLNIAGYGHIAQTATVQQEFMSIELPDGFAACVEKQPAQPRKYGF